MPSSYEASALRSLFLNKISENQMSVSVRNTLISYLGIHFKINGFQLTRADTGYVMIGMILILSLVIILASLVIGKRKVQIES